MRRKLTTMFAVLLVLCFSWSLPVSAAGPLPKNTYSAPSLIYGGRDYSPVFNAQYYLAKYEDLRKAFGTDEAKAFSHFLNNGIKEGRRASENFDVRYYRDQYPDLAAAFGNNYAKYYIHYLDHGIKENRKGSDGGGSGSGSGQGGESGSDEYGAYAYELLRVIDANYPNRINNNSVTTDKTTLRAMGQWINDQLVSYGYQPVVYRHEIEGHDFIDYACRKPGTSGKRIVIGAHYDSVATHGCEDNGTGVALTLELAKRFYGKSTPYTLEFCFFDGEEFRGYAGSNIYLALCDHPESIVLYVNIDCVGAGDLMYAYGGIYNEAGALTRDWGLQMTFALADELSIPLHVIPETVARFPSPTRDASSDHYYFNKNGIPYVYFEANRITYEDGSVIDEQRPHYLNTLNAAFQDTNGQIIHTKYDDLSKLEALLPGVIQDHLSKFSRLITALLTRADTSSPAAYSGKLSPAELIKRYSPLQSGDPGPEDPGPEEPAEPEEPSDFDAGRYSLVFDADYYLDKYPDLRAAYGTDKARAFKHFLRNGMKEARQASAKFNVQVYRARYKDLDQAFGNNWTLYYEHYINNGYKEKRIAY
ncbi:MAG: M28 family peptidase [Lachnospiraceae bacterium]|nr:M28 family peptidase [Lachnospiraceae bacterium]